MVLVCIQLDAANSVIKYILLHRLCYNPAKHKFARKKKTIWLQHVGCPIPHKLAIFTLLHPARDIDRESTTCFRVRAFVLAAAAASRFVRCVARLGGILTYHYCLAKGVVCLSIDLLVRVRLGTLLFSSRLSVRAAWFEQAGLMIIHSNTTRRMGTGAEGRRDGYVTELNHKNITWPSSNSAQLDNRSTSFKNVARETMLAHRVLDAFFYSSLGQFRTGNDWSIKWMLKWI